MTAAGRSTKANGPSVLETELGAAPPSALRSLNPQHQEDLAAAIAEAKRRQAKALAEAGENALKLIPRVLRDPVRRMFG